MRQVLPAIAVGLAVGCALAFPVSAATPNDLQTLIQTEPRAFVPPAAFDSFTGGAQYAMPLTDTPALSGPARTRVDTTPPPASGGVHPGSPIDLPLSSAEARSEQSLANAALADSGFTAADIRAAPSASLERPAISEAFSDRGDRTSSARSGAMAGLGEMRDVPAAATRSESPALMAVEAPAILETSSGLAAPGQARALTNGAAGLPSASARLADLGERRPPQTSREAVTGARVRWFAHLHR